MESEKAGCKETQSMAKAALSFHIDTPETMSAEVSFVVP
ncbi:hypothetical protein VCHA43P277_260026 [Vibrio chagasii]|nr:hypothetical protein VCHA27O13_110020 [Vibrio chagasii]CAK2518537.1 Endoribonuclease L-PSP [Vibrio crassostreae]CAH6801836.1 hypothetical protein VCHA28O22_120020 [Vibrio chagasii]CAH6810875.1 hypothetical protein VCHA35P150_120026 [Vibrio chagasii]CAH6817203.1 hypothetical protein VCHA34P129_140091 [Vibrio chagasii]